MKMTSLLRIILTRSLKPFVFQGGLPEKLDFEDLEDLGLYVHIPFCRSLCSFCPYCKEIYDRQRTGPYKAALMGEIDLVCKDMKGKKHVTSLYFGGGTPALMIDDLKDIIDKLKEYFIIDGGIGAELHPKDITGDHLEKLLDAGVTMVSIGMQSFHEDCLRKLGRSGGSFIEKLHLVRSYNFDVVDVDLIFAIPGQTDEILQSDLKTAFDHGATQVSTYPFIDFTFADNKYKPMSLKVKKNMLKNLIAFAKDINIERTSVWTFARRNTQKYSSVTRDAFLGFGVSATTLLRDRFKINTFSVDEYINRVKQDMLATSLTLKFTKRQRAAYYLFWSAYSLRIPSDKFEKLIGSPLQEMYGLELKLAKLTGILRQNGTSYYITEKATYLYHSIEQAYTTAYIDKMWNVSRKTAFPDQIILK